MAAAANPSQHSGARLLIVDDHPVVREAFSAVIDQEPDLEVSGGAETAEEALQQVKLLRPDLVVIDISLKQGNGIDLCKQIHADHPEIKILVVSAHDEEMYADRVLRAGAAGFLNKKETTEQLLSAIRSILDGRVFLSSHMTERLLYRAVGSNHKLDRSPVESLSDRELQVFQLIGEGFSTRQIAVRLGLSPKTVESYREHIKQKLNLSTGAELTRHAVQFALEDG